MKLSDERIEQLKMVRFPSHGLESDIDSVLTELQSLRRLLPYVQHLLFCQYRKMCVNPCTCGLDEIRKEMEEKV